MNSMKSMNSMSFMSFMNRCEFATQIPSFPRSTYRRYGERPCAATGALISGFAHAPYMVGMTEKPLNGLTLANKGLATDGINLVPKALSPSSASSFSNCPASWAISRRMKRTEDPLSTAHIGTVVHKSLEELYSLEPDSRTEEKLWVLLENIAGENLELLDSAWDKARHIFDIENPSDARPLMLETPIEVDLDGVPFYGIADRIDKDSAGLKIVDYKTSGEKKAKPTQYALNRFGDSQGDQVTLYALALGIQLGEKVSGAELFFTGVGVKRIIELTPARKSRVKRDFHEAYASISKADSRHFFEYSPSPLCGWCPLSEICPESKSAPKVGVPSLMDFAGQGLEGLKAPAGEQNTDAPYIGSVSQTKREEVEMATKDKWSDERPWEDPFPDIVPNANGYGAQGAFGLVTLAYEHLKTNGHKTNRKNLAKLVGCLYLVVKAAQVRQGKFTGLSDGLNTRLRGGIRSVLAVNPFPLEGSEEDIRSWMNGAVATLTVFADLARELLITPPEKLETII